MASTMWPKQFRKAFWAKVDKTSSPNGCWFWLGRKNPKGYGCFTLRGKFYFAHRVALAIKHDIPLPPKNVHAAHDCPGGDNPSCVRHVAWKAQREHVRDHIKKGYGAPAIGKGGKNGHAKLTARNVQKIRKLYVTGQYTQKELAELFGLSRASGGLWNLLTGRAWKDVGGPLHQSKKIKKENKNG